MEKLFDFIYNCIYNLGLVTGKIIGGFFKKIAHIIKKVFHFNKASFSSAKTFVKRSVVFVLIAAVIGTSVFVAYNTGNKVKAVALIIDGETIGYAATRKAATTTENKVAALLGEDNAPEIELKEKRTVANNIRSADFLLQTIIEEYGDELTPVNEVYIDGELLCAVKDGDVIEQAVAEVLELAKKVYPDSSVSLAEKITVKQTYYSPDNKKLYSNAQFKTALNAPDTLTVRHTECQENVNYTEFETVEIQTNTLFVGDTRVRRSGQNGTEYAIDLVTYVGDKKVLSEPLMSIALTQPVTQIVERGIRAESLSMGSYTVYQTTGVFCWPVVNLYTVTSPYGHRSLGYHRGIDISGANASGSLVVAGAAGTVTEAGWSTGGYGNYVKIDHGNGVETLYAHMLDNSLMVSVGDVVQKGQTIGRVGNTGYSFGAHLHFEVRLNGNRLDPAPYLGLG
ncbi:MAG: peptidoglycan DD-metalloendopeptidase family protein [Clostridia bacterium]|nr:peptidoglycan DD-metalloendopeptidase family protein [Clostridia bacterium]